MIEEGRVSTCVLQGLNMQGYEQQSNVHDVTSHSALMAKNQRGPCKCTHGQQLSIHRNAALLYHHDLVITLSTSRGGDANQAALMFMHV